MTDADAARILASHGIQLTSHRISIARILFEKLQHLSAEEVFRLVNKSQRVSKATVYNVLGLFARQGIIREVTANPSYTFYDTNVLPHHHIYYEETGDLEDVDISEVCVSKLPPLSADTELRGVDVVIRVRRRAKD